jgi:hypothetical protein
LLRVLAAVLTGLLPGVLDGQVHVDLGLVDPLAELVAGLGGGGLRCRLGLGDALLELVEHCGEVHASSWIPPAMRGLPVWLLPSLVE